jgi:hypothetical protein
MRSACQVSDDSAHASECGTSTIGLAPLPSGSTIRMSCWSRSGPSYSSEGAEDTNTPRATLVSGMPASSHGYHKSLAIPNRAGR